MKVCYGKNLISQAKHMLWDLKKSASMSKFKLKYIFHSIVATNEFVAVYFVLNECCENFLFI